MNTRTLTIIILSVFAMIILAILFVGLHLYGGFEKTSSFFTSLGVFLTLGAIAVAIYIPNKIANQQNKIALFEKKYELYTTYDNLIYSAKKTYITLDNKEFEDSCGKVVQGNKLFTWLIFVDFLLELKQFDKFLEKGGYFSEPNAEQNIVEVKLMMDFQNKITLINTELDKIRYLFSLSKNELKKLDLIVDGFRSIHFFTIDNEDNNKMDVKDYVNTLKIFTMLITDSTILETMQQQLELPLEVK